MRISCLSVIFQEFFISKVQKMVLNYLQMKWRICSLFSQKEKGRTGEARRHRGVSPSTVPGAAQGPRTGSTCDLGDSVPLPGARAQDRPCTRLHTSLTQADGKGLVPEARSGPAGPWGPSRPAAAPPPRPAAPRPAPPTAVTVGQLPGLHVCARNRHVETQRRGGPWLHRPHEYSSGHLDFPANCPLAPGCA